MRPKTPRASGPLEFTAAEAARRIEDWFRRGYVMFSDLGIRSTWLLPAGERPALGRPFAG